MSAKTSQLQIRISPEQKVALKRLADEAGLSVSAYVLSKVVPSVQEEVRKRVGRLGESANRSKELSALIALLGGLSRSEFPVAVGHLDTSGLSLTLQNCVAAAVEQEARRKRLSPPSWVHSIAPPPRPTFAWELPSLRPHLMRVTPLTFKRRNVFVAIAGDERR